VKYLLIVLLFAIFIPLHPSYAAIIEGNSSATVDIHTQVGGEGSNVSTHVETTVNGKTQIYNSNKPGDVHIENNGERAIISESITPVTTTSSLRLQEKHEHMSKNGSFWHELKNFLKNLLRFL